MGPRLRIDWVLVVAPAIYAGVIGRGDVMACSKPAIEKIQLAQHCILHTRALRGCGLRAGVAPDTRRALCEPVSVSSRTGLRPAEMEIEKWRAETGAQNPPRTDRNTENCRPETGAPQPNLRERRRFSPTGK